VDNQTKERQINKLQIRNILFSCNGFSILTILFILCVLGSIGGAWTCQVVLLAESVWLWSIMLCANRQIVFSFVLCLFVLLADFARSGAPEFAVNLAFVTLSVGLMIDYFQMVAFAAKRRAARKGKNNG